METNLPSPMTGRVVMLIYCTVYAFTAIGSTHPIGKPLKWDDSKKKQPYGGCNRLTRVMAAMAQLTVIFVGL